VLATVVVAHDSDQQQLIAVIDCWSRVHGRYVVDRFRTVDVCIIRDDDDIELKQDDEIASITVVEMAFGSVAASQRQLPTAV